jgi:glycosyltransferase involved in cell wall biosynthesis
LGKLGKPGKRDPGSKIRILQVLASGAVGGGTTHLLSLVGGLDPERFELHVACSDDGPLLADLARFGVRTHRVEMTHKVNPLAIAALASLILRERIDQVHFHGTRAGLAAAPAALLTGRPRIYTVHGWSFHPRGSALLESLARMLEHGITRVSQRVICVGDSDRSLGLRLGILDDPRSRVIHNGVLTEAFMPRAEDRMSVRAELGVPEDCVLVSHFGRLTEQKGQTTFLEAVTRLMSHPTQFMLVGDGEDREKLIRLAHDRGISERVLFMGFRSDVPRLLAATDIVVLPSLWEGLPICLLEAMAAGKPVVASAVDGSVEVVVPGQTGLLVPPEHPAALAEAIAFLITHPQVRDAFGSRGQERVRQRFSLSEMLRATGAVYLELASGRAIAEKGGMIDV